MNEARILIAGGGTGGHIFPGLAVAAELLELGAAVHWLGAERGLEGELVAARKIPISLVPIEGLRGRGWHALRAVAGLPKALAQASAALRRFRPDVVLGVGGYASAAGILAGAFAGVPFALQEQNAVPGWTNRLFAPSAEALFTGFEGAGLGFPGRAVEWTGNPVRREFFDIPASEPGPTPRLLVLGGSQGSLFLNRSLPRAFAELAKRGRPVEIHHQAGMRWADIVRTAYLDCEVEAEVVAFVAEPWKALAEVDLVIARAGALTVTELAAAGRPALFVPFAASAGNHQELNARAAERLGGARVLTESEASPERIASELDRMIRDSEWRRSGGLALRELSRVDAAETIAQRLLAIGGAS